jgi:2-methylfumaryl-CoA hydratase
MNITDIGGPWFEDFAIGTEFDAPTVALTAGHTAIYQALFGDRLRLPLATEIVHPMLAIHFAIGQSTWASQRVKANLFYRGLVLQRPVLLGDSIHTTTRVVALRQNKPQPERAATGMVALEMHSRNQRGEDILHCWRCPMIPCRDPAANTGRQDPIDKLGLGTGGELVSAQQLDQAASGWQGHDTRAWRGTRSVDLQPNQHFNITARDTVTSAPELVRMTLNMAMAHTDAKLSYLGDRLVYGGHVISMAAAQLTRALPNLLTLLAWESCDHTAPVVENDRLRSTVTIREIRPHAAGTLLKLHVECFAARGTPEIETRVLDWVVWALSA